VSATHTWSPPGSAFAEQSGSLVDAATDRAAITGLGASGARLERLTFSDGQQLVLKEISPDWDWMMAATHDTGRAAELWLSGAMGRLPAVIDPAIVRIEQTDGGWRIYMRDVDAHFLRRGTVITRTDARRLLDALAAMDAAFWDEVPSGLCTVEDLIGQADLAAVTQRDVKSVCREAQAVAPRAPSDRAIRRRRTSWPSERRRRGQGP